MLTEIERKELARNIRHRLADMLGSQWIGALDAAMDEMLLDEIGKFVVAARIDITDEAVHDEPNDGKIAWPLRERPEGGNPHRKRDEDGDPYLRGIMDKD